MKEKNSDNNTNPEPKEPNATELEGKQNNLEGNHTPSHKRPASPSLLPSKRPDAPTTPGSFCSARSTFAAQFGQSMSIFHVFFMVSGDLSAIYSESCCSPDGIVQRTNM